MGFTAPVRLPLRKRRRFSDNLPYSDPACGLVIEYGGSGAKVRGFVSDGATRRALQMVGNNAEVEVEVRNFADDGRPVLLGVTERLEFVDAPGHVADLKRYRARGYRMAGNRIRIVTDRPMEVLEVHPPSRRSVDLAGVTVEYYPPQPGDGMIRRRAGTAHFQRPTRECRPPRSPGAVLGTARRPRLHLRRPLAPGEGGRPREARRERRREPGIGKRDSPLFQLFTN